METKKLHNDEIKNKQIIKNINNFINSKNEDLPKEVKYILKYSIESLFIINNDHINAFIKNNNIIKYENTIKVLYINYFIKDDNVEIKIVTINKIEDISKYDFVSIEIINNKKKRINIFNIKDFENMIKNIEAIIFFKIIMDIKNADILKIDPDYKIPPLELFYINYFLKNKKDKTINNNFNITFECSPKYIKNLKNKENIIINIYYMLKKRIRFILFKKYGKS